MKLRDKKIKNFTFSFHLTVDEKDKQFKLNQSPIKEKAVK